MCCIPKHDIVLCLPYMKPKTQTPPPPHFHWIHQLGANDSLEQNTNRHTLTNIYQLIFVDICESAHAPFYKNAT